MEPRTSSSRFDASQVGSFEFLQEGGSRPLSDIYRMALTSRWRYFFLGLFVVDLIINCIFACIYSLWDGCIEQAHSIVDLFFFSVETLATVGYGEMAPANLYGHIVSVTEIMIGMAFTAISTGLIFIRFARPKPKTMFASTAVITEHDGYPCLMIRVANGDISPLLHAEAKVTLLLLDMSEASRLRRRLVDLDLLRSEMPFFPLTWTIIHRIDEKSPLNGLTLEDLRTGDARVVLALSAYDSAIQTDVHVVKDYTSETLRFGYRFIDMVSRDGDNRVRANLKLLDQIEPDSPGPQDQPAGAANDAVAGLE